MVIFFIIQFILLSIVRYRNKDFLQNVFLHIFSSRSSLERKYHDKLGLDEFSFSLLLINSFLSISFSFCIGFSVEYYLKSAILWSMACTLFLFTLWYFEYFLILISTANRRITSAITITGNYLLIAYGIISLAFNVFFILNNQFSFQLIFAGIVGFLCLLFIRVIHNLLAALKHGFLWYYLILYFCAIYLAPGLLIIHFLGQNILKITD